MKVPRRFSQTVAFTLLPPPGGCDRPTFYSFHGSPIGTVTFHLETIDEEATGFCHEDSYAAAAMAPVEHRRVDLEKSTLSSLLLPDAPAVTS